MIRKLTCLCFAFLCFYSLNCKAESSGFNSDEKPGFELLISRLDIEKIAPGKEDLHSQNSEQVLQVMLDFYKRRKKVAHPVSRFEKKEYLGSCASAEELKIANDALEHIFVGQRAYEPVFCGDDIDWNTRPVPDMEWVWQLNRMYFWNAMGKAYWHTGDEKYAKEWCSQLKDWTRKNPNDEEHKHAWRSIEAGIRGHSWMDHYQRFIDSPYFDSEVLAAFLNSCHEHAEYLMTVYRSGSNWGLMEAEGMAFIAITFPEFKNAEKWRKEAFRRLNIEIDKQVYDDGHQRELAMGYHLGCIRWFMRTWELAKLNGLDNAFSESYLRKVEKMCEVPMKICLPDGTNVQFGDAWAGKPGQHNEKFMEWAEFFERDDFLFMATDGKEGIPPGETAYALPESGLYSMRSGWDKEAVCVVLKCGPNGGGHCQPDNGTFDLYAGGRNLMPDGGSYIYSGNPEGRKWFRQTAVHQTLTLDNSNSAYAPRLLKWQPGIETDILVVENQSYENLSHRRSLFFVDKRYLVVVDEAIGDATGEVGIHFQLAPGDAVIDGEDLVVRSNHKEGWNVWVKTMKQKKIKLDEEEGWVSFEYTKKEPRPAFRFSMKKESSNKQVRFVTVVVPFNVNKPVPDIVVDVDQLPGYKGMQLEITENGIKKQIGYQL